MLSEEESDGMEFKERDEKRKQNNKMRKGKKERGFYNASEPYGCGDGSMS